MAYTSHAARILQEAMAKSRARNPDHEMRAWDGIEALREGHIVRIEGETLLHTVLTCTDERGETPRVLVVCHESTMTLKPTENVAREFILPV